MAHKLALSFSSTNAGAGPHTGETPALLHAVALAFAHSTQTVFYIMAAVMALVFVLSVRFLPSGLVGAPVQAAAQLEPELDTAS